MNRRGYATVVAIVAIGLLAVVLSAVGRQASDELRRARIDAADAQASQLLSAAARAAEQQAGDDGRKNGTLPTPAGKVTLAWDGTTACGVDVTIDGVGRHARLVLDGPRVTRVE